MLLVIGVILLVQLFRTPSSSLDPELVASAKQTNEKCPLMLNDDTRLDSCLVISNSEYQWNYTLVNYKKGEPYLDTLKVRLESYIMSNVGRDPNLNAMADKKVTVIYHYQDKNGVYLFNIKVPPGRNI